MTGSLPNAIATGRFAPCFSESQLQGDIVLRNCLNTEMIAVLYLQAIDAYILDVVVAPIIRSRLITHGLSIKNPP